MFDDELTKQQKTNHESWQSSTGDTKRKTQFKANDFETSHEITCNQFHARFSLSGISGFGFRRFGSVLYRDPAFAMLKTSKLLMH